MLLKFGGDLDGGKAAEELVYSSTAQRGYCRILVNAKGRLSPPPLERTSSGFDGQGVWYPAALPQAGAGAPVMSRVKTPAAKVKVSPSPPAEGAGL